MCKLKEHRAGVRASIDMEFQIIGTGYQVGKSTGNIVGISPISWRGEW